MIRTTITIDEDLTAALDRHIARTGTANRSEAIRDLVRRGLNAVPDVEEDAHCIGVVSCTVDQSIAGLERRIRQSRQDRHEQVIFAVNVPIDHDHGLEIAVMRGTVGQVNDYAQSLFLAKGVRHGIVALTPVAREIASHAHADSLPRKHLHLKVRESF